ncbi:hypothetical protein KUV57_13350 [Epibacterium sp. DP7N7-1]|nr:hypothetical protein [Epibacterium sp. DP7N7-1]
MKQLMTRNERKLAARLQMADLREARKRGIWSDGNLIYRASEIDERIRQLSRRLINDTEPKRPALRRFANVMVSLGMIRRKPEFHGLPKEVPDMLAAHARNTYVGALRQTPNSLDHFILSRRLARKLGSLSARDYPIGEERERLGRAFEKPVAFVLTKDVEICVSFHGEEESFKEIEAGTRLFGRGNDFWTCPDGSEVEISPDTLVLDGVEPLRLRRSEKRVLDLPSPRFDIDDLSNYM